MNIWAYTGGSGILGGNVMTPRAANAGAVSHDGVIVMTDLIVPNPDSANNLKRCSKCLAWLPLVAFCRDKHKSTGYTASCKACRSAEQRARRAADPDLAREGRRQSARRFREKHPDRVRAGKQAYYKSHSEQILAQKKAYYAENTAKKREYNRRYYLVNGDTLREYSKQYNARNPDRMIAHGHRRRALKRGAGGTYTAEDLAAIRAAQTDKKGRLICWRCGKPIKGTPHLDHWIPLAGGGTNDPGNLHYMHPKCNMTKSAKHPTELGRLL